MKTITLEKLVLTNYRNIEHQEFLFGNGNYQIVGENRIGKTNTLEAIHYLLTDKLMNNDSDISKIKPLSDTKKMVTVEGFFNIDGTEVILKKVYGENWVKVRNSQEIVFKGHETTYYVNDIKQSTLKDYNSQVEDKFGFKNDVEKIDLFQLLINPFYVGTLGDGAEWTALRRFIIKLVGDVTDEDVFAAKPETTPIRQDLIKAGGKIDQIKKLYAGNKTSIKEDIIKYESQIELLEKTERPSDDAIAVASKAIDEIDATIANLRSKNGPDLVSSKLKEQISNKALEISNAKLELSKSSKNPKLEAARSELKNLIEKHTKVLMKSSKETSRLLSSEGKKQLLMSDIERFNNLKADYVKSYNELKALRENPNVSLECPTCHRKYGSEQSDKILAEYIANINSQMEKVKQDGIENKAKKNAKEEELDQLLKEVSVIETNHESTLEELKDLENQINNKKNEISDMSSEPVALTNPHIENLEKELKELSDKLTKSTNDYNASIIDINNSIIEEQNKKPSFQKVLNDKAHYDYQMQTLEDVRVKLKNSTSELTSVEQKIDLVNIFVKTKLEMLDENMYKVFGNIKFKLLQENINGGFDAICKPYIYNTLEDKSTSVVWKSGSKSEMVSTGIAIVEKIKAALDLPNLPYIFDEGGEISADTFKYRLITKSQIICVKVKDDINQPLVMPI